MGYLASSLLSLLFAFSPQDAVINERPPVERSELEALWKIDCADARRQFARLMQSSGGELQAVADGLVLLERDFHLCAHIDESLFDGSAPHAEIASVLQRWRQCLQQQDGPCIDEAEMLRGLAARLDTDQGDKNTNEVQ